MPFAPELFSASALEGLQEKPEAGIAVYVRGQSGKLAAARIYDDADPSSVYLSNNRSWAKTEAAACDSGFATYTAAAKIAAKSAVCRLRWTIVWC